MLDFGLYPGSTHWGAGAESDERAAVRPTSFVIAHRISTIRDADVVLVMEAGRIVEQGTHAELLAAGGAFARLYEAQFAAPVVEV